MEKLEREVIEEKLKFGSQIGSKRDYGINGNHRINERLK
jgi:hypothetical protein